MSSWQYAFLFPQSPSPLYPAKAIRSLTEFGAEFDGSIRLCAPVDNEGHLLDVGEEIALKVPYERDLIQHLEAGKSFSTQLRNTDIVLSVEFVLGCSNPHISIGWSRRFFSELSSTVQSDFWRGIRAFAKNCNAGYVVIIDDAPDHFEDRFLEIDGKRIIDTHVNHRYGLGVREVWLQSGVSSTLPEGVTYGAPEWIGDGFERYFVTN